MRINICTPFPVAHPPRVVIGKKAPKCLVSRGSLSSLVKISHVISFVSMPQMNIE